MKETTRKPSKAQSANEKRGKKIADLNKLFDKKKKLVNNISNERKHV